MKRRIIGAIAALLMATVGTVMVLSYIGSADERALAGAESVKVLVVAEPVPAGTPAEQLGAYVSSELVPSKVVAAGAVTDLQKLAGQVATVDLLAGEQLLGERFALPSDLQERGTVAVPQGMQEVTISLEPSRVVGGQLEAGDTVGVFISMENGPGNVGAVTHLELHKVLVTRVQGVAVAPESSDTSATVPANNVLVTLAVKAPDAEKIVFAQEFARTWLSKEPTDASEKGARLVDKDEVYQ
ncbi:Flp pilus assembly protein CpaB [Arthrobacter sulfonylureivorans]|uniref:Flp pilus assembly protein CpaB n=1 Tax=Arthrobacter sulfonylureivorans TaxID=2486855 RepID=UPI0039E3B5A0